MRRCWHRGGFLPLTLAFASILLADDAHADVRAAPEIAVYKTHNTVFRSRFSAGATWSQDAKDFTSSAFEYDIDVGLGSFFRRYIFKDPNAEKSKRLSLRLGYAFLPDLTDDSDNDEKRLITEATFRFPLGNAWLLSDRNRLDFRRINDIDSTRYRNRLRIERNIALRGFRTTPYSTVEGYYSDTLDDWNRVDGTLGIEFPWRYQTVLEIYFTWQFERNLSDNQTAGLTLQKHL